MGNIRITVTIATHLKTNGQFIQRRVVEVPWDLPPHEEIDTAYLDVVYVKEDGGGLPLIRK